VSAERLVVICDDFNTARKVRMAPPGSAGGHQELASVIHFIRTEEFARLRMGIGLNRARTLFIRSFVFKSDKPAVTEMVQTGSEMLAAWLKTV
jgi:PTH1 family peptidyl-tRNA hydrolase